MNSLSALLNKKFQENSLAHFYILSTLKLENQDFLNNWCESTIEKLLNKDSGFVKSMQEKGHPDFLVLATENKNYCLEDFDTFFRFLDLKPFEFNHRFIIINDAHKITTVVANKLLKPLEEPTAKTTIFLLNPKNRALLPTIKSRGIELRPRSEKEEALNFPNGFEDSLQGYLKGELSLHETLEKLKDLSKKEQVSGDELIVHWALEKLTNSAKSFQGHDHFLKLIQEQATSREFHNAAHNRMYQTLQFIKGVF